jgi:GT2 family glycosyltransferase
MDVIILSYAATPALEQMTRDTLASLYSSENEANVRFNTLVIESATRLEPYQYPGTKTIYPNETFGYNRFLNLGIRLTSSEFICLANNDLRFHEGWASGILDAADANPDVLSFSPMDPWLHAQMGVTDADGVIFGYEKMRHVTGWCLVVKRELVARVGALDEQLLFWYVDDDYIQTLRKFGIPHALVSVSKVDHLSGETIKDVEVGAKMRRRLTRDQWLYYDYKWNHQSRLLYRLKSILSGLRRLVER